jgi:hypothetical protein
LTHRRWRDPARRRSLADRDLRGLLGSSEETGDEEKESKHGYEGETREDTSDDEDNGEGNQ